MPSPLEATAALVHASTPAHQRRVEEATRILTTWYERSERPYVPTSGGKDSTVVLHIARTLNPNVPAVHADHEFALPETTAHLATIPNLTRVAYRRWHADFFTSWDVPPGETPPDLPPGTIWWDGDGGSRGWAKSRGYDGSAIGLRAAESRMRRKHIRSHGTLFWAETNAAWHALPLAWWTDLDIWAYLLVRNVPYSAAYDRLTEIGVPLKQQRTGPFAVERALWAGQLAILKRGWPNEFAAFAEKHPGANAWA